MSHSMLSKWHFGIKHTHAYTHVHNYIFILFKLFVEWKTAFVYYIIIGFYCLPPNPFLHNIPVTSYSKNRVAQPFSSANAFSINNEAQRQQTHTHSLIWIRGQLLINSSPCTGSSVPGSWGAIYSLLFGLLNSHKSKPSYQSNQKAHKQHLWWN